MLDDWRRERRIQRVLRAFARQRVAMILQPGNVWVLERAVRDGEGTAEALTACHMRGWVEILEHAVPHGELTSAGELPPVQLRRIAPVYRLTDSGWAQIRHTHSWIVATFWAAIGALLVGVLTLLVSV